jgi:hypothetical protein
MPITKLPEMVACAGAVVVSIAVYPIGLIVVAERTHSSIQRLEVIGG